MSWATNTSPNFPFPSFLPNLKSDNLTPLWGGFYFVEGDCFPGDIELFLNFEKLEFWLFGVILSGLSFTYSIDGVLFITNTLECWPSFYWGLAYCR